MVMRRGDSSMPSVVMSSNRVSPDKARVSPWRVAPTVAFVGVVSRVESLPLATKRLGDFVRGRMPPSGMISEGDVSPSGERQVEGLFESLLAESFGGR